jgi:DNA modification methylase
MIKLFHGDCIEQMALGPDNSVDLILCDPPYGTTACKWDSVIPFEPMWEQIWRVLKPNGACVLFGSEPFSSALRMSQIKRFKYDWVWVKPSGTGHLNAKKMPMNDYELISVFYQKQVSYVPQFLEGVPYKNKQAKAPKSGSKTTEVYGSHVIKGEGSTGKRYPKRVLHFNVVGRGGQHPTQKPVALLEYLIKTYTVEGETVLDFTMGSGSTGVAAVNLGRSFVGVEQDEKYYSIAEERINNAIKERI